MDDPHNGSQRTNRPTPSPSNAAAHHVSSIPRPKSSSKSSAMGDRATSPLSSSPDAITFNRARVPRSESPQFQRQPSSSPLQSLERPSSRSNSTTPRSLPRPAKSNPAISANGRSIKDLVAKFDQGENVDTSPRPKADVRSVSAGFVPVRPHTPSSRPSDHTNARSSGSSRIPTAAPRNNPSRESLASRPSAADGSQQKLRQKRAQPSKELPGAIHNTAHVKPLFGEVLPVSKGGSNLGHGIQSGVKQSLPASAHEQSFGSPHSTANEAISSEARRPKLSEPQTISNVHDSLSGHERPIVNGTVSREQHYEADSVAPLKITRSTPATHQDGVRNDSSFELGCSSTPATYSQRDFSPNNAAGGEQRLKAYIKELSPKKSPPLRSSRPRQQVSSNIGATEAGSNNHPEASFGKMSASDSDTSFDSSDHTIEQTPQSRTDRHANYNAYSNSNAHAKESQSSHEPQLTAAVYQRPVPALKLQVSEPQEKQDGAPLTGNTDIEDESPTSSRNIPGGFPTDNETKSTTDANGEEKASIGRAEHDYKEQGHHNAGLRALDTGSATHGSEPAHGGSPEASKQVSGEMDEAGTIHILLGENPLYNPQYSERNRPEQSSELKPPTRPAPHPDERSFTPIQGDSPSNSSRRSSHAELPPDSDAHSIRSRIIEQYSHPWRTEDFPQHLQERALDMSPDEGPQHLMGEHVPHTESGRASSELNFDPQLHQSMGKTQGVPRSIPLLSAASRYHNAGYNDDREEIPPIPPPKNDVSFDERNEHDHDHGHDSGLLSNSRPWQRLSQMTHGTEGSEQPSLPEIKDTGGGLDFPLASGPGSLTSHRASAASEINDSGWYGERSSQRTPSTVESGTLSDDRRESTQRPFGQPDMFDTPASSTSRAQSLRFPEASSRNNSTDNDNSKISESDPDSKDKKWLNRRRNVIQELCETEHTFSQDMSIIDDIYLGTASQLDEEDLSQEDVKVLFSNTKQVVALSKSMYTALKEASRGVYVKPRDRGNAAEPPGNGQEDPSEEADRATRIGEVFLSKRHEIERVYAEYMRNQHAANERLKELQKSEKVELWLKECRTYAADLTSAWSLDALIVKPAQRMTKYPLLLGALLKDTPEDHPNMFSLQLADTEIKGILDRINDQKRRHETLKQIMQQSNQQRRDMKFAKFLRLRGAKVKQKAGLSGTAYEDTDYVGISQKFNTNYFQLQLIIKDIEGWKQVCEQTARRLNQMVDSWENMLDTHPNRQPELESKWRKWATTVREVYSIAFLDHAVAEYANFKAAQAKGGKIDKRLKEQGENFLAINDSLKSELPTLYEKTSHIGRLCQRNLITLKRDWNQVMYRKLLPILDIQGTPESYDDIEKEFNGDFKYASAALSNLPICNGAIQSSSPPSLNEKTPQDKSKRPSTTSSHGGVSHNSKTPPSYSTPDFGHRGSAGSYTTISQPGTNPRPSVDNGRGHLHSEGRLHQQQARHGSESAQQGHVPGLNTKNLAPPSTGGTFLFGNTPQATPDTASANAQSYGSAGASSVRGQERHLQNLVPNEPHNEPALYDGQSKKDVLFIAASLYEFRLDRTREHLTYPFLTYECGEIFDILDIDGDLWFARNQDTRQLGWIWERHFTPLEDDSPGWQELLAKMTAEEDGD
ncbi:MAG: hypothetical protein M1831_002458 [Alyxoria varia]|nr:MAG: hypothetical protein M1831_002458 [Alyxoria varia]